MALLLFCRAFVAACVVWFAGVPDADPVQVETDSGGDFVRTLKASGMPWQEAARDPQAAPAVFEPRNHVELAFSDESLWVSYARPFPAYGGRFSVGFLYNEKRDDSSLYLHLMRYGSPGFDPRLNAGLGLAFYSALTNRPYATVFAVAVAGRADYTFETAYPLRLVGEISFAPDITTFDLGKRLVDIDVRAEVDVSPHAAAFVGYRYYEVELLGDVDERLADRLHLGIRLGW